MTDPNPIMPIDRGGPCRIRFTYEQLAAKLEQAHTQIEFLRASNRALNLRGHHRTMLADCAVYDCAKQQWVIREADIMRHPGVILPK
jgi:hypothetical protein